MSDKDAIDIAIIWNITKVTKSDIEDTKDYFKDHGVPQNLEIFQYLILKGYSVPLFFGLNHWANGKTAIELNLAIPKK